MHRKHLALAWFLALGLSPVVISAAGADCDKPTACCDDRSCGMPCCQDQAPCDMPCCAGEAPQQAEQTGDAIAILFAMDPNAVRQPLTLDSAIREAPPASDVFEVLFAMDRHAIRPPMQAEQPAPAAPTQQRIVVLFQRPVWLGEHVLMGKYVIEHDTARQARGEPCTYIYRADDMTAPIVMFHCEHLERGRADQAQVVLQPQIDGTRRFLAFQFAGETAAHGHPSH